jgi:hypothetical protein
VRRNFIRFGKRSGAGSQPVHQEQDHEEPTMDKYVLPPMDKYVLPPMMNNYVLPDKHEMDEMYVGNEAADQEHFQQVVQVHPTKMCIKSVPYLHKKVLIGHLI